MAVDFFAEMNGFIAPQMAIEQLPSIVDFIDMYDRGATLYPVQSTLLKIMFLDVEHMTEFDHFVIKQWLRETENGGEIAIPLDTYERMDWCIKNGYKNFNEFIFCGGRRGGKGFIGGKAAAYKCAQMLALGAPQRYFGIAEGKDLYLDVLATQYSQAQGMLYNDIKESILLNDWLTPYVYKASNTELLLQTPDDRRREEDIRAQNVGRKNMMGNTRFASIHVKPSAAVSSAIRGRASFQQCYDEFAHGLDTGSNMSSSMVYEAATPSTVQFGKYALVYIPSSPWSKVGKFYELYSQAFEIDPYGQPLNPQKFAIRIPSWRVYDYWEYDRRKKGPIILSPSQSAEMRSRELANPETFDVEFRANFAETENAYLNPKVIESLFRPYPDEDNNRNHLSERGMPSIVYRAHADAGRSQDYFCYAIGHRELMEDGKYHVFIDLMQTWQPPDFPEDEDGIHRVNYVEVTDWIKHTLKMFPVYRYTMDQWNSAMVLDEIRKDAMLGKFAHGMMQVACDSHTQRENFIRWEAFKTACYQGWVHIPHKIEHIHKVGRECCLVEEEMKFMIIKNGNQVTWPEQGRITHGDMVDCVSTIVAELLGEQVNYMLSDDVSNVVGAARGGYNQDQRQSDNVFKASTQAGDDYMRRMGYY